MAISRTTRTHMIYQFIILTLLFLGIGYNELLPDRKYILFIAFIPMFCYQLVILSCCAELLPVPRWLNLTESTSKQLELQCEESCTDSLQSSQVSSPPKTASEAQTKPSVPDFGGMTDRISCQRRWEKSVLNLGASPKILACPQKSKSWMNLSDAAKSVSDRPLSRESSLDLFGSISTIKLSSDALRTGKKDREARATKAKSWKPTATEFDVPDSKDAVQQQTTEPTEERPNLSLPSYTPVQQEDSEISKSYSFPFRQKRLETWLEMKEAKTEASNQSLDMPYWETVGYNLAVKYEARRRRRAASSPTESDTANEMPLQHTNFHKSIEVAADSVNIKPSQKKTAKSASNCINKIKVSFYNLISKKKDEGLENINNNSCKVLKPPISLKIRKKNLLCQAKKPEMSIPELPQFLSNERPLMFYPKYIPFEKERFEHDVQNKIVELSEEQQSNLQHFKPS